MSTSYDVARSDQRAITDALLLIMYREFQAMKWRQSGPLRLSVQLSVLKLSAFAPLAQSLLQAQLDDLVELSETYSAVCAENSEMRRRGQGKERKATLY